MQRRKLLHRVAPYLLLPFVLVLNPGRGVHAQSAVETCASFIALAPDPGLGLTYTFPLHYGKFADVEVGAAAGDTVQLEVTVFKNGAIKDRRIWVLVPGRVELLTEILDVENLFEIGDPLLVRMNASGPLSAMLIRE